MCLIPALSFLSSEGRLCLPLHVSNSFLSRAVWSILDLCASNESFPISMPP
jgi:hypothetical protein